ncbi:MAG: hypothetical protein JO212_09500 [Acetobacteraceae bacterium]|nr:hypothetical protein [Acetobacteraceae bacterium]
MWPKFINPLNPKQWCFVDPAYAAAFLTQHPGWKRVPSQGKPVIRTPAKPQPPRPVAHQARQTKPPHSPAPPLPRDTLNAVALGYTIHEIREMQRQGMMPRR